MRQGGNPRRSLRLAAALMLLALAPWPGQCGRRESADGTLAPPAVGAWSEAPERSVILMIVDGGGFNAFDAASFYEHGALGLQPYDAFPVKLACATFMLGGTYDPAKRWSDFDWAMSGYTDSAAAATALYSGEKTFDVAISADADGRAVMTIGELAKAQGRGVGVVTTVPFSRATPACLAAHNLSRNNYASIARQMIELNTLDVIMGCGDPDAPHDPNEPRSVSRIDDEFAGGTALWEKLKSGTLRTPRPWTLIRSKEEFEALADGTKTFDRVLGVARARGTLQYSRAGQTHAKPFDAPLRGDMPDLATMSLGALNVLSRRERGFVLVIEGGAVDWAAHAGDAGRMIEEMVDFNRAVDAVARWIESHGGWEKNLLIITADHETGALWGPDEEGEMFPPIVNAGKGNLPGCRFRCDEHTNALVPLFAKGVGAHLFDERIRGDDPRRGAYVDNTDVFGVMKTVLTTEAVPAGEPAGAAR